VGKWCEDELKGVQAALSVTDGDPELKGFCPTFSRASARSDVSSTGMEPKGNEHPRKIG
jgi:hypothetical protein